MRTGRADQRSFGLGRRETQVVALGDAVVCCWGLGERKEKGGVYLWVGVGLFGVGIGLGIGYGGGLGLGPMLDDDDGFHVGLFFVVEIQGLKLRL